MSEHSGRLNLRISPSSLDTFQACPLKFKYQKLDQLEPVVYGQDKITTSKDGYKEKGDFIHVLMRIFYKSRILGIKVRDSAELAKMYGRMYAPQTILPIDVTEYLINTIWSEYVGTYANSHWKPVAVEKNFSKIFYEDEKYRFIMEGILDLVAEFDEETLMPVDHKTASRYGMIKTMGNQFKTYLWSGPYKRLCVNQIYLQKTPDKGRFAREYVHFDPSVIADWMCDVIEDLKTMVTFMEHEYFPRRERSCYDFNRQCSYLLLCKSKLRMHEFIANRDYQIANITESPTDPKVYKKRNEEDLSWIRANA